MFPARRPGWTASAVSREREGCVYRCCRATRTFITRFKMANGGVKERALVTANDEAVVL